MDGGPPVRRPCYVDCLRDRRRCDASTLKLGHHAPPDLVDLFPVPLAVPEVHSADVHSSRFEDRLENVGSMRLFAIAERTRFGRTDGPLLSELEILRRVTDAQALRH